LRAALAHDDNHAALAGLIFSKATVAAVGLVIRGAHMPAEICTVNFDLTGDSRAARLRSEGFADLVRHDECRLVLAIQVAAQLKGAMALRAVHENRNRQEIVADGQFAAGENRAARDAELVIAGFALE
jgi:hypothetical protein